MSGLKSLAKELPKYGRNGDSIVAHINPQEAALLKAIGGSGTINPHTGLPEYLGGFVGKVVNTVAKPVQQAVAAINPLNPGSQLNQAINQIPVIGQANQALNNLGTQIFQPLEKAIVQPASAGLAQLDKSVGKAIPGGWGTVASIAGSAMGVPTPFLVGLGALNGSGVMHKGGSFNLQGAMMGGAMAYGAAELGDYVRGAVPNTPTVDQFGNLTTPVPSVAPPPPTDGITSLYNSTGGFGQTASAIPQSAIDAANIANPALLKSTDTAALNALSKSMEAGAGTGLQVAPQPSMFSNVLNGNFGYAADQLGTSISEGASSLMNAPGKAIDSISNYDYSNALDKGMSNASQTGEGIKNLVGAGDMSSKAAGQLAATTAKAAGTMSPTLAAGAMLYSGMGLAALDEQRKYLEESKAANAISQAEYDSALAEINRSTDVARKAVAEHPFNSNPDRSYTPSETTYDTYNPDDNLYARLTGESRTYKEGGEVKHYAFGGMLGAIGPAISKAIEASNPTAIPADVGFQNLQSEGMRTPIEMSDGSGINVANLAKIVSNATAPAYKAPSLGSNLYEKRSPEETLYERLTGQRKQYAVGGSIDDESGMDEARGLATGNMQNGFMSGGVLGYAAGGMPPRFLSGGGDGMSDSIPATIGGKQEARLADGEFVIPADVVSHLGNGSSKAGAKQLYSMMDKVRSARTGTKKQGKQINPRKYLTA
jgi:hypothetical protein